MSLTLNIYHDVRRGGRNYMEDVISIVTYDKIESDPNSHSFACFLVFDGHGGVEAAKFAEENLLNQIKLQEGFHSHDDEIVVKAIKDGFLSTHKLMWKVVETWPKTQHGLLSTSGTTVSMVLIRKGKLYVAHVGDSTVIIGEQHGNDPTWKAKILTTDHKPDSPLEKKRIEKSGGEVMWKSGVPRVVWRRERTIKLSNKKVSSIDCVPFLAVARSLGDLWSYNESTDAYSVSPEPDVSVHEVDLSFMKCLIVASDGLWNVLSPTETVKIVKRSLEGSDTHWQSGSFSWMQFVSYDEVVGSTKDPATALVDVVLSKCRSRFLRADNTSAIVILFEENKSEPANKINCMSPSLWNINVNVLSKPKSPSISAYNENRLTANNSPNLLSVFNSVASTCLKKSDTKTAMFSSVYQKCFGKDDKILDGSVDKNSKSIAEHTNNRIFSLPQISSFVKKNVNEAIMDFDSPSNSRHHSFDDEKLDIKSNCVINNSKTLQASSDCTTNIMNGVDNSISSESSVFNLFEICKSASQHDDASIFGDNIVPQVPVCFITNNDSGHTDSKCHDTNASYSVSRSAISSCGIEDLKSSSVVTEDEKSKSSLLHSLSTDKSHSKNNTSLFKITYPLESTSKSIHTKLKKRKCDSNDELADNAQQIYLMHLNNHNNLLQMNDSIFHEASTDKTELEVGVKFRSDSPSSSSSSDKDENNDDTEDYKQVSGMINVQQKNASNSGLKTTVRSVSSACKRRLYSNYMSRQHRKQKLQHRSMHPLIPHDSMVDFVKACKSRLQLRRIQVCS